MHVSRPACWQVSSPLPTACTTASPPPPPTHPNHHHRHPCHLARARWQTFSKVRALVYFLHKFTIESTISNFLYSFIVHGHLRMRAWSSKYVCLFLHVRWLAGRRLLAESIRVGTTIKASNSAAAETMGMIHTQRTVCPEP
jgi:hypothetical protein